MSFFCEPVFLACDLGSGVGAAPNMSRALIIGFPFHSLWSTFCHWGLARTYRRRRAGRYVVVAVKCDESVHASAESVAADLGHMTFMLCVVNFRAF